MDIIPEEKHFLHATHQGNLKIGDKELLCAVLEDGTRVISRNAIFKAFGRTKRGRKKDEIRVLNMPSFIDAKNLQPFIGEDLKGVLRTISYINKQGRKTSGYKAEVLPLLCDVYLSARAKDALAKNQELLAVASEILVRSLSKVGIVALVDEATGYQEDRDRDALHRLLAAYISEELLPWAKRFPNEFYHEIYRLKGWKFHPLSAKRPMYVGKITNDLVYKKLPPGVLDELKRKNPPDEKGRRPHKHHQFLTEDIGNPHLERHIISVMALMRAAVSWAGFMRLLERAFPTGKYQQEQVFDEEE